MALLHEMDLEITLNGDLVVDEESGDFAVVMGNQGVMQGIFCRLKSSDPEWFRERLAANLEDLIGQPNTKETGQRGEEMIRDALLIDGLCEYDELYIQAVPIDKSKLLFYVFFKSVEQEEATGYEVELNLSSGAKIRRVS